MKVNFVEKNVQGKKSNLKNQCRLEAQIFWFDYRIFHWATSEIEDIVLIASKAISLLHDDRVWEIVELYDYDTVTFDFLLLGLKSFCIGKSSGIYTNPFEQKSFVVCSNGVSEERQCPEAMLFNPKEKMCDVPDQRNTMRTKKRKETTKNWLRRSRWWFLLPNICLMEKWPS